ncbi:hypothetical protein E2C01_075417 [Portunus trituberculatus]|uniref:Uncharacterized protein n=1 Tax=Portunus trituberculatus TaxID=210409 RepID=A0A5B7IK39_PORTR|nr:hypothetical protein [Portunus trituberculatus]
MSFITQGHVLQTSRWCGSALSVIGRYSTIITLATNTTSSNTSNTTTSLMCPIDDASVLPYNWRLDGEGQSEGKVQLMTPQCLHRTGGWMARTRILDSSRPGCAYRLNLARAQLLGWLWVANEPHRCTFSLAWLYVAPQPDM